MYISTCTCIYSGVGVMVSFCIDCYGGGATIGRLLKHISYRSLLQNLGLFCSALLQRGPVCVRSLLIVAAL